MTQYTMNFMAKFEDGDQMRVTGTGIDFAQCEVDAVCNAAEKCCVKLRYSPEPIWIPLPNNLLKCGSAWSFTDEAGQSMDELFPTQLAAYRAMERYAHWLTSGGDEPTEEGPVPDDLNYEDAP